MYEVDRSFVLAAVLLMCPDIQYQGHPILGFTVSLRQVP